MKLLEINQNMIAEANWYKRKKYENVIDLLRQFADDNIDDIDLWFISFTAIDKLGINPRSGYRTPIGIYSYPLRYVIEHNYIEDLPFAAEQPYINLFKIGESLPVLNTADSDSMSDYYVKKFRDKYKVNPNIAKYDMRSSVSEFWLKTREFANKDPKKWSHVMRSVGVMGVIDSDGTSTIHTSEPTQAVFFSKNAIEKNIRLLNRGVVNQKSEDDGEMSLVTLGDKILATKKLKGIVSMHIKNGDLKEIGNFIEGQYDHKFGKAFVFQSTRAKAISSSIVNSIAKYNKYELIDDILQLISDKAAKTIKGSYIRQMMDGARDIFNYKIMDKIASVANINIYDYVSITGLVGLYPELKDKYQPKAMEMFNRYLNDPDFMEHYNTTGWNKMFEETINMNPDNPLALLLKEYLSSGAEDDMSKIISSIHQSLGDRDIEKFTEIMDNIKNTDKKLLYNHKIEFAIVNGVAEARYSLEEMKKMAKLCSTRYDISAGVIAYAPIIISGHGIAMFRRMMEDSGIKPSPHLGVYIDEYSMNSVIGGALYDAIHKN